MDLTAGLDAACSPEDLFAWVRDLERYPAWLDIVRQAQRAEAHALDPGPAWHVNLRGRLGPLARSKRLRMVRVAFAEGRHARFERLEVDGRTHSPWELDVEVAGTVGSSRLIMHLSYGGALFGPVLHHVLTEEVDRARPRLAALAEGSASA